MPIINSFFPLHKDVSHSCVFDFPDRALRPTPPVYPNPSFTDYPYNPIDDWDPTNPLDNGIPGSALGCTDPDAVNYDPTAIPGGECFYDSDETTGFSLNFVVGAPSCSGDFVIGDYTNPFPRNSLVEISGTVDDDIVIDGVVYQDGMFPYHDVSEDPPGTPNPCPGSDVLNGLHNFVYRRIIPPGYTVNIVVRNNFRGFASLHGIILFY